jgi:methylamine--corrinoid protein Co-methyltransferase
MHRPVEGMLSTNAGACTEMLLDQIVARGIALAASGRSCIWGVRTAGGVHKNRGTGLESKFAAEVLKASAGMSRKEANNIVRQYIPKYEERLKSPPLGKLFTECYDLTTLQPTAEWRGIYDSKIEELKGTGLRV